MKNSQKQIFVEISELKPKDIIQMSDGEYEVLEIFEDFVIAKNLITNEESELKPILVGPFKCYILVYETTKNQIELLFELIKK